MTPFRRADRDDPATEDAARQLFAPFEAEEPLPAAAAKARQRLLAAAAAGAPVRAVPMRYRVALAIGAIAAPLLAVSAVGALTGNGALSAPVGALSSAAHAIGIGGKSDGHREDAGHRSGEAGDNGQPGSCPGKSCEAPGHNKPDTTTSGTESGADSESPTDHEKPNPHENGHGCDDKLFGAGDPPFAGHDTPVGPCNDNAHGKGPFPDGATGPGRAAPGGDADTRTAGGNKSKGNNGNKGSNASDEDEADDDDEKPEPTSAASSAKPGRGDSPGSAAG